MKRSGPPKRTTPLQAHTELRRSSELPRSTPLPRTSSTLRSVPAGGSRTPGKAKPARQVSNRVRLAVYLRDDDSCVRCGRTVWAGVRQLHHRVPRGAGGRDGHERMSALITLCGSSATDPHGCHQWCESWRTRAQASGWLVPMGIDPTTWPVRYGDSWFLLDDDGDRTETNDPNRGNG